MTSPAACDLVGAYSGANVRYCSSNSDGRGQLIIVTSVANPTIQAANLWLSTCIAATETRVGGAGGAGSGTGSVATFDLTPSVAPPQLLLSVASGGIATTPLPTSTTSLYLSTKTAVTDTTYVPWLYATDAIGVSFQDVDGSGSGSGSGSGAPCRVAFIPAETPSGSTVTANGVQMQVTYQSMPQCVGAGTPSTCLSVFVNNTAYTGPYLLMSIKFLAQPVFVFANAPGQVQAANARLRTSGGSNISWLEPSTAGGNWRTSRNTLQKFYAGGLVNATTNPKNYGAVQIHLQTSASVVTISVPAFNDADATVVSNVMIPYDADLSQEKDINKDPEAETKLRKRSTSITLSCQQLMDAPFDTWFGTSSSSPDYGLLKKVRLSAAAASASFIFLTQTGQYGYWLYFRCAEDPPTMAAFAQDVCFHAGFEQCSQIGGQSHAPPLSCRGYFDVSTSTQKWDDADAPQVGATCRAICSRTQKEDAAARQTCQSLVRAVCDAPGAEAAPECACQRMEDSTVAIDFGGTTMTWAGFKAWFGSIFGSPADDEGILTQAECWWPACTNDTYGSLPSTTIAACPASLGMCLASIGNISIVDSDCVAICVQTACPAVQRVTASVRDNGKCTPDRCKTVEPKLTQRQKRQKQRPRNSSSPPPVFTKLPGSLADTLLPAAIALLVVFVILVIVGIVMACQRRR